MNRRDMIIVAVLMNAGLLAVLFMMAVNSGNSETIDQAQIQQVVAEAEPPPEPPKPQEISTSTITVTNSHDELDTVIKAYSANTPPTPVIIDEELFRDAPPAAPLSTTPTEPEPAPVKVVSEPSPKTKKEEPQKTVEVTVKKGDSLDKIARANGTTVKAIKKANNLESDRLKIGQVLKVPVGTKKADVKKKSAVIATTDKEFYTIKNGDNPWKIAKQFNVRFEDLLTLNNLDEDKARRLKAGDKIRVR